MVARTWVRLAFPALVLAACAAPPGVPEAVTRAPTPGPSEPAPDPLPPTPTPPEPRVIGDLRFTPLDEGTLAILAMDRGVFTWATASVWHRPQGDRVVGALDPGTWSGNYDWWLDPGEFPDAACGARRSAPAAVLAARTPAFRGDFTTVVTRDLRPIVDAWAPDAVFANVEPVRAPKYALSRFTDDDIRPVALHVWPVRFASAARRETLTFYRGSANADAPVVLALLTRWEACDAPDAAAVPIDRPEAIRRLTAAIADPAAASVEERTGRDYFVGTPYAQAPVRHAPATPPAPDFSGACTDAAQVELRRWFGRPVWFISASAVWYQGRPPSCAPAEHPSFSRWAIGGGLNGLVDAETGAVIRFQRAMRYDAPPPWPEGPMASAPLP